MYFPQFTVKGGVMISKSWAVPSFFLKQMESTKGSTFRINPFCLTTFGFGAHEHRPMKMGIASNQILQDFMGCNQFFFSWLKLREIATRIHRSYIPPLKKSCSLLTHHLPIWRFLQIRCWSEGNQNGWELFDISCPCRSTIGSPLVFAKGFPKKNTNKNHAKNKVGRLPNKKRAQKQDACSQPEFESCFC